MAHGAQTSPLLVLATLAACLYGGRADDVVTMPSDQAGIATAEQEFEVIGKPIAPNDEAAEEAADAAAAGSGKAEPNLVEEWDKHMEGFVPELLLTFPLAARTDEFFYEDVPEGAPPVLIRGGFFASSAEVTSSVEFRIQDPKGNIIFEKSDEAEGLFHFVTSMPGTYTFIVSNHRWMEEKVVTFAVGKGNETHLQAEHLVTVEDHVKAIDKMLVDIQTESTYLWIRQKSHMKAIESIHTRVLSFCVIEFLILIGISGFQVYYIKGLLSDRRVL